MSRALLAWSWFLVVLLVAPVAMALEQKAPDIDMSVMRALPGTFKVHMYGDLNVSVPTRITLLSAELDRAHRDDAATIPSDLSPADAKWVVLARNPHLFLKPSVERETFVKADIEAGHGSAFAVSREGILLTNRHVVELVLEDTPLDAEAVIANEFDGFVEMLGTLMKHLGDIPSDPELKPIVFEKLSEWYGLQCRSLTKFRRAEVSIAYTAQDPLLAAPKDVAFRMALSATMKQFGMDPRTGVRLPVTVVARGGPEVENDVAILRLSRGALDAVVCLPLADARLIREKQPVTSLGFPGFKYDKPGITEAELHGVSVEKGAVVFFDHGEPLTFSQRAMLVNDYVRLRQNMLLVNAVIRPGSSGGPLINAEGKVAGLNVRFHPITEADKFPTVKFAEKTKFLTVKPHGNSLDVAVPISNAQKLLAANQITPDVGPTTQLWHDGLALYQQQNYAAAEQKFREVARRQVVTPDGQKPFGPPLGPSTNIVSHYVQDMIRHCENQRKQ